MTTCTAPTEMNFPPADLSAPAIRLSVREAGMIEAERHKWIESEKAGRDLGEFAIRNWVHKHWNGYLREKWLEHILGVNYWIELDHDDFGLLRRAFQGSPYLGEIIRQLKDHGENLTIILWALKNRYPMAEIIEILLALDMNSRRIEFDLGRRLCSHDPLS